MINKIKFAEVDVTSEKIRNKILACLENNWVTNGPIVRELEKRYAEIFGYKYVVAVNSGTTADLLAALSLYDVAGAIPRQSEIIVPALGFISAVNAMWMANFNLRFCDINRETLNIDENNIEALIDVKKTKAILAINTMGRPCNMAKLREICDKHNLILISDNCEGHLCKYNDLHMSEWADIVTYSGYSAHLPFSVEFGWVGTNNQNIYNSIISNRSHGRPHGSLLFEHESIGWNGKPTDLHASVGINSLEDIRNVFNLRTHNVEYLYQELNHLNNIFHFSPITGREDDIERIVCPHAFALTFKEDNEARFHRFCGYLEAKGIEYKLNFKCIPTQQKAYTRIANYSHYHRLGDFPEAEFVGRNGLHLPVHQFLSQEDIDYMIKSIKDYVS